MKRYLIVFSGFGGEHTEKLIQVTDHEDAVREAKSIAQAFECRVQLKQLGIIDDWEIRPENTGV